MTRRTINQHVDVWERKIIFKTSFVKISEINTDSHLAIFFGNRDDIGQPLGVLNHW